MSTNQKDNDLSKKRKAYLRAKLLARRRQLIEGLDRKMSRMRLGARGMPPDPADWASEEEASGTELGAATIASATLADIEHALEKLCEGTFGKCEQCDCTIPEARLKAMPFARLCIRCKEEDERRQAGQSENPISWARLSVGAEEPEWPERTTSR